MELGGDYEGARVVAVSPAHGPPRSLALVERVVPDEKGAVPPQAPGRAEAGHRAWAAWRRSGGVPADVLPLWEDMDGDLQARWQQVADAIAGGGQAAGLEPGLRQLAAHWAATPAGWSGDPSTWRAAGLRLTAFLDHAALAGPPPAPEPPGQPGSLRQAMTEQAAAWEDEARRRQGQETMADEILEEHAEAVRRVLEVTAELDRAALPASTDLAFLAWNAFTNAGAHVSPAQALDVWEFVEERWKDGWRRVAAAMREAIRA